MRILRSQYVKFQESSTLTEVKHLPSRLSKFLDENQNCADGTKDANSKMLPPRRASFFPSSSAKLSICDRTIQKRRNTIIDCSDSLRHNMENCNSKVKVRFHFYEVGPEWYTKLYNDYRGQLWQRLPLEVPKKSTKWCFQCHLCSRLLGSFTSIKSHLNLHLGLFPHRCGDCPKQYASRNSLLKHHKTTNHIIPSYHPPLNKTIN